MKKKIIAGTLAGLLLMGAVSLTACNSAGDTGYEGPFDFERSDLTEFLDLPSSVYDGVKVDKKNFGGRAPVKKEDFKVDELLLDLQFYNRKENGFVKSSPVGIGDDVYLYILSATSEGKPVADDFFTAAYGSQRICTLGYHDIDRGRDFGEDFDRAMTGFLPKNTCLIKDTKNKPEADSILSMTYTFAPKNKDSKAESYTGKQARTVLSELPREIVSALTEKFVAYGDTLSFEVDVVTGKNDKDEDVKETYVCTASVHFTAVETAKDITFKLPEDFFDKKNDKEELVALNGKEVTFTVIVSGADDYTLPALTAEFIKEKGEVKTDSKDLDTVKNLYLEKYVADTNKQIDKDNKTNHDLVIWRTMIGEASMQEQGGSYKYFSYQLPQDEALWRKLYEKHHTEMYNNWYNNYRSMYPNVDEFVYNYTYQEAYNTYGPAYAQQMAKTSLYAYAMGRAEEEIRMNLVVYTIFRQEGMELGAAEYEAAYQKYIDSAIEGMKAAAKDDSKVIDKAYVEDFYGKDKIREEVRNSMIQDKVIAFVVDNCVIVDSTASK